MIKVNLYIADPTGENGSLRDEVLKYAENMNRMYQIFDFNFTTTEYPGKLSRNNDGKYQVKKMQNAILPSIKQSDICFVIFLCRVTEIARVEMDTLMENLTRQKKMAFQSWFINDKGLAQVFAGITQAVAGLNNRTAYPEEEVTKAERLEQVLLNQAGNSISVNHLASAEIFLNQAITIRRKLVLRDRERYLAGLCAPCQDLGTVLFRMGRMKDAEMMYSQALGVWNQLPESQKEAFALQAAGSYNNLGILQVGQNRYEDAGKNYREAAEVYQKLLKQAGETGDEDRRALIQRGMADTNANLGVMYTRMNQPEQAAASYEAAIEGMRALKEGQDDEQTKLRFVTAANSLGVLRNSRREYEKAGEILEEARNTLTDLEEKNAAEYEPRLAQVLYNLFHASRGRQDTEHAREYWKQASDIAERRKETSDICRRLADAIDAEKNAALKRQTDAAQAAEERAKAAAESGNIQEAAKAYKEAADVYHSLPGGENQVKSAAMYHEIAEMLWDREQLEQAEICYKNEVILTRSAAEENEAYYPDLAMALFRMGRFCDEAKGQEENEYLTEAVSIAEKYREKSELAQEVYENLTDGAIDFSDSVNGEETDV